jgi:hypothetical protein
MMVEGETDVFDEVTDEIESLEVETTTEAPAEVEVETKSEETTETEKGVTESKDEAEESPSSKDEGDAKTVPMAALLAERKKRQELEAKLSEANTETVKAPDPVTDPDGHNAYIQGELHRTRIEMSQNLMRSVKDDYDDMEGVFKSMIFETDEKGDFVTDGNGKAVIADPKLQRQFSQASNPAEFAYLQAKQHLKLQERLDPNYEENLKKQLLEELKAKKEGGLDATEVPDLTNAAASGSNNGLEPDSDPNEIDVFD